MRTILLFLVSIVVGLPGSAQTQSGSIVDIRRQIERTQDVVEASAQVVAQERRYLREIPPVGNPTALFDGALHLRIADVPFLLYLQPTNHHTTVRLESRSFDLSDQTVREAKAFLQEVATRATARTG